jgi:ABC-type transport system involved in multi-copper enzyme maturation permease subunit
MSAPTAAPIPIDIQSTPHVPMSRLAAVEFRKSLDTRAGRWIAGIIVGFVLLVLTIYALAAGDNDKNYEDFLGIAGVFLGYFMPILIILLVTSEASQRNGLVTFTLEPRRSRIIVAKLVAGLLLAVCVMVLSALMAAIATVFGSLTGGTPEWGVDGNLLFNGFVLANVIGVLIGFAIATLLMNTPGSIVVYFAYSLILPIAVGVLSELSEGFDKAAPWIDFNTAQMPLFEGNYVPNGEEWAQLAVTGTIWLIIPLILGIQRLLRIEFK